MVSEAPTTPSASQASYHAGSDSDFLASIKIQLVLVALLSILPYLPALRFGFVYDDRTQVLQNPLLNSWYSVPEMFSHQSWSFWHPGEKEGYYRPAFLMWLALNHHLFGLNAIGWHAASLVLHGMVSSLCFLLLRRHGFFPPIALAAALLFALHPAHIESVVWISGSTDLLAAVGLLGSLLLYWRAEGSHPPLFFGLSLLSYFFALLSKETSIVFPAIIFAYALFLPAQSIDWEPQGRFRKALWKTAPFLIVACAYLLLRRFALDGAVTHYPPSSLKTSLASAPGLLAFYFRHLAWPVNLTLFYNLTPISQFSFQLFVVPLVVVLVPLALLSALAFKLRDVTAICGLVWLLFPVLPVLFVPFFAPGELVHDRYLYLPSIGLALLMGFVFRVLVDCLQVSSRRVLLSSAVLSLLMGVSTVLQSQKWRDDFTLYYYTCSVAPDHPSACNNLAGMYVLRGDYVQAKSILIRLFGRNPENAGINANLGMVSYRLGEYAWAEQYLRRAISLDPSYSDAHLYLGMTCYRTQRLAEAESHLRRSINLSPETEGYHLALGSVLMNENRLSEACEEFHHELAIRPDLAPVQNLLHTCENRLSSSR